MNDPCWKISEKIQKKDSHGEEHENKRNGEKRHLWEG